MRKKLIRLLSLFLAILCEPSNGFSQNRTDTPPPDGQNSGTYPLPTLKFELPDCPVLEFCIVPLQIGDGPFATKEIWLGGRGAGGFKEPPTRCMLAGSMVMPIRNQRDWCLLIGKNEVTIAQWHSILGTTIPDKSEGGLPVAKISRAEVALFIEKLNEKMRSHQLEKIIKSPYDTSFADAFIRLPTEAEWEFCARGGTAVDSTTFDKPTPYEGNLNQYEWFFGQDSSKGKLKQIGLLKPNPLGIYDMLGNATEMVESLYQIEYSQGRLGGGVVRGGDFRTEEADLRSSRRGETPWVFPDGTAYRSGTVGIRLAIGTMIVSSMAAGERLESEWEQYTNTRAQPSMAPPSESSVSNAAGKELEEISGLAKDLAQKLEIGESKELSAKQALQLMEVRVAAIRGSMKRADARFAKGAVSLSSIISMDAIRNSRKIILAQARIADPNIPENIKQIAKDDISISKGNLGRAGAKMEDCLRMFEEIPKETVAAAFDAHLITIEEHKRNAAGPKERNDAVSQIAVTKVAKEVAFDYILNRRVGLDKWRNGLMDVAKKEWVEEIKKQN